MMRLLHPRTFLIFGAFLGGLWLMSLSATVLKNAQSDSPAGPVTVVGIVSRTLFTPHSLVAFATANPSIESHDRLATLLKRDGLDGIWYATRSVEELSDGTIRDNVSFTRATRQAYRFPTIQADFLAFAGKPQVSATFELADARVVVISDAIARREPSEVLGDLIEREKANQREKAE